MIINGREYKRLVEENKKLRERYEKLEERYEELRRVYDRLLTNNLLDDFEFAVLSPKNSHILRVWNDGRFEEKVFAVEVKQERGCMPYFKIEK